MNRVTDNHCNHETRIVEMCLTIVIILVVVLNWSCRQLEVSSGNMVNKESQPHDGHFIPVIYNSMGLEVAFPHQRHH